MEEEVQEVEEVEEVEVVEVVEVAGDPGVEEKDQTPAEAAMKSERPEGAAAEEAATVKAEELREGSPDDTYEAVLIGGDVAKGAVAEEDAAAEAGGGAAAHQAEVVRPEASRRRPICRSTTRRSYEGAANKGAHREVEANEGGAVNEEEAATGPAAKGDASAQAKKMRKRKNP